MAKIVGLMDELRTLSKSQVSFGTGLAMYVRMLDLLHYVGVLKAGGRLYYPAIGADLFPFKYPAEGWSWDTRLPWAQVEDAFQRLTHDSVPQVVRRGRRIARVQHSRESFLAPDTLNRWSATLQAGEVLFLKHAREYFIAQNPTSSVTEWMAAIGGQVPRGVYVVLFEPAATPEGRETKSLSEHFVESKCFNDITPSIVGRRAYRKLQGINERILGFDRAVIRSSIKCRGCTVAQCVNCNERRVSPEVYFDAIGALTVLERR